MGVIFLIHQYFPPTGAQIKLTLRLVRINSSVKIYSGRNRPLLVFNLPMALAPSIYCNLSRWGFLSTPIRYLLNMTVKQLAIIVAILLMLAAGNMLKAFILLV